MDNNTAYVTSPEAARLLGVSRATVVKAIREGRLKGRMVGRYWWVEETSLTGYRAASEKWELMRTTMLERSEAK